jgi:N-acetylneuraminic acid mutarotase
MVAFTIGNKGYIMKPHDPDGGFWEYNFAQNTWKRKADFPAFARYDPACFSIGTKGYVVGGWKDLDTYLSETWQYNQSTDNWSQKAGIGNPGKAYVTGFSINNKGYIVCGRVLTNGNETYTKKLMQYDPSTDNWTTREPFPGDAREYPSVFVIDDKAYVGGGGKDLFNTVFEDFYRYNPATDSWSTIAGLPGVFQMFTFFGFSLNSLGYCVTEFNDNLSIYKYTPLVCP